MARSLWATDAQKYPNSATSAAALVVRQLAERAAVAGLRFSTKSEHLLAGDVALDLGGATADGGEVSIEHALSRGVRGRAAAA